MPTLLPIKFRTELARSLHRDIINGNDCYYLAFGRTLSWDYPLSSETVPTPADTRSKIADAQSNILAVKRIESSDVVLMIPRIDWVSGTIYDRYSDDVDLSTKNFYVYVPENHCIYKCLNRPDDVTPSTDEPLDTGVEKFQTSDNYWWKLVYEIPVADRDKFITTEYLPVRHFSSGTSFDYNGVVSIISVNNGGSGYTAAPMVIITGDGQGASAKAIINASGAVDSIEVITQGYGYSYANVEIVGDGDGALAVAELLISDLPDTLNSELVAYAQATNGQIDFIDIVNAGSGYVADNTSVTITGDGQDAVVVAAFSDGKFSTITTANGGEGKSYTNAVADITTSSGTGAVLDPIIGPPGGHGSNVPSELLATVVGFSIDVSDVLTDFFINNDFRQVIILKNVHKYEQDTSIFTDSTGDASYTITVPDYTNYHLDDQITTNDGGLFTVVNINGPIIKLHPTRDLITLQSELTNETTSGSLGSLITLKLPDINVKTGDVVYLKNIFPVTRVVNQTETLKLFIHF